MQPVRSGLSSGAPGTTKLSDSGALGSTSPPCPVLQLEAMSRLPLFASFHLNACLATQLVAVLVSASINLVVDVLLIVVSSLASMRHHPPHCLSDVAATERSSIAAFWSRHPRGGMGDCRQPVHRGFRAAPRVAEKQGVLPSSGALSVPAMRQGCTRAITIFVMRRIHSV